jgi:hypothetical protein
MHQAVRLKDDLPADGLRRGDVGAIVHVFQHPRLAYEVEFVDERGQTVAHMTLLPDQVEAAVMPAPPAVGSAK